MHIKIGSRGSKLALWQSNHVAFKLQEHFPELTFEIVIIKTKGDKIQDKSLQKIGDKGLFVKEIEEQLLLGTIDIAVHSMKDMPSELPDKLVFSKTMMREDPRDVLILNEGKSIADLPQKAVIGTGSMRRAVQVKSLRSDIIIKGIRGNVETRLEKLRRGDYDGIIMAAAGLKRIGLEDQITTYFSYDEMVPACAQGALAVEVQEDRVELLEMLNKLEDKDTHQCVEAERTYLETMAGNCHIPIGGHCEEAKGKFIFRAIYGTGEDESYSIYKEEGQDPIALALEAAEVLKNGGMVAKYGE